MQAAARGLRAGGIDRRFTLLDVLDFPFLVHYEGGAVGDAYLGDEDPISLHHFARAEIAEQREGKLQLISKHFLGRGIVCTIAKNLGFGSLKFANTSLVRQHLLRSTTGEGSREEGQDDVRLAAKIRQPDLGAARGGQSEVRSHVPDLEAGLGRGELLRAEHGGKPGG